jgi:uncharacterized membrane protein YdbT with pleckstrin-like domain
MDNVETNVEEVEEAEEGGLVWEDRKRHLGIPISFTKYGLDNERLFVKSGAFMVHHDQTMYYRVQDIQVSISAWQWFFGVGTVTVISTDKSLPDMKLENVRNPLYVKELIHERVEKVRAKLGIRPNEFMK